MRAAVKSSSGERVGGSSGGANRAASASSSREALTALTEEISSVTGVSA